MPEVYELTNVLLALTSYGVSDPWLIWKEGEYYERVRTAFDHIRSSPAMQPLQLGQSDPVRRYYELRENSFPFGYSGDDIVRGHRYGTIWDPDRFAERRTDIQQLADAMDFRTFYSQNREFYDAFIAEYAGVVELDSMVAWLEREFDISYDHYTVVLSPLVHSSHSARAIRTSAGNEALMFVAGPQVNGGSALSPGVRRAIVQRIIFTEVDHLFVNPVSDRHHNAIQSAFADRARWTTDGSSFYSSPVAVFNEYMTWAVLFLYLDGRMDPGDFSDMLARTEAQMVHSRRFQRFAGFNRALLQLYRTRPAGTTVADLYPAILDWARQQ